MEGFKQPWVGLTIESPQFVHAPSNPLTGDVGSRCSSRWSDNSPHVLSVLVGTPRWARMRSLMRAWASGVPSWKVPKSLSIGTGRLP